MELEIKSELQNKLIDYMTGLETGINNLVDFGSEQIPVLVQEILTFSLIERGVFVAVDLVVLGVCVYLFKKMLPHVVECLDDANPLPLIGSVLTGVMTISMITSAIRGILICTKIHFAPRLFMLEYIKDLIQ